MRGSLVSPGLSPRFFGLWAAGLLSSLMACSDGEAPRSEVGGTDAGPSDAGDHDPDGGSSGDGGQDLGVIDVGGALRPAAIRAVESSTAGWAVGTLRRVPLAELPGAGLGPDDVVWTDGAPATLPTVGALLVSGADVPDDLYAQGARRRIPVLAWPEPDPRLTDLVGREVVLTSTPIFWSNSIKPHAQPSDVHLIDVTGFLDPDARARIAAARAHPTRPSTDVVVLSRPIALCGVGQEVVSVWALHHAAPRLTVTPVAQRRAASTHTALIDHLRLEYREGGEPQVQEGAFGSLPEAEYTEESDARIHRWASPAGVPQWSLELSGQQLLDHLLPGRLPLVLLENLDVRLVLSHPDNLLDPSTEFPEERQAIDVWPCDALGQGAPVSRTMNVPGGALGSYELEMGGLVSRQYFTTPITKVRRVELPGLLSGPLVLEAPAALTGSVEHHNFAEHLIVEPTLDPNLSAQQRAELAAAGIHFIYLGIESGFGGPGTVNRLQVRGPSGAWRNP